MRRTRSRSRGPRPRYEWAVYRKRLPAGGPDGSPDNGVWNLLEDFNNRYGADLAGFTITRIRGRLDIVYDPAPAAFVQPLSFGIRVGNENDIRALSNPGIVTEYNDPYADWMWRTDLSVRVPTETTVQGGFNPLETLHVDGKAKRRLDDMGQSLYLFTGLDDNSGFDTTAFDINVSLYMLLKRP